jgi:hypothetical protein
MERFATEPAAAGKERRAFARDERRRGGERTRAMIASVQRQRQGCRDDRAKEVAHAGAHVLKERAAAQEAQAAHIKAVRGARREALARARDGVEARNLGTKLDVVRRLKQSRESELTALQRTIASLTREDMALGSR